jgi:C4-dicarboxylate-specific signal transduction histidine kinase/integral membrane sensor domain MASE1
MSVDTRLLRRDALDFQGIGSRLVLRTALVALLVSAAYYLGTAIGLRARFPATGPSILWPPNAILLAVLLLTPVRRWGIYLLAAFPVHFLTEQQAGFPLALNLGLFITNCGQALLGAVAVRRAIGPRIDFDNLRHVIFFIGGAAVLAPFVCSFVDVWLWVTIGWPEGIRYWQAWWVRFASNALTILVVTPALVLGISRARRWWRRPPSLRRGVEAAILVLGLAAAGAMIGVSEPHRVQILMYTPLPLLLWAAVRFGSAGVSASLLAMTLCMTLSATRPEWPTGSPEAAQTFSVQFFMVMVVTAVSLMFLAAVIRERERAEAALTGRLAFERLLSEVSAGFAGRPSGDIAEAIQGALARIAECLDVDRATLAQVSDDGRTLDLKYASYGHGNDPLPGQIRMSEFPWAGKKSRRGEVVCFASLEDLPDEACTDRENYGRYGIKSVVAVPLMAGPARLGVLGLATVRDERSWPGEMVERLRLLGEIFTAALMRQRADTDARQGEALNRAVLASLSGAVAVVNRAGLTIRVNETWGRLSRSRAHAFVPDLVVGASFLEACRGAAERGVQEAPAALVGIQAVLDRTRAGFSLEYAGPGLDQGGWWEMLVVPLDRPEGGAVITHRDVSDRKRGEHEAQQQRQSLAHAARVLAVGELAGSLAHELNQPLTAMVTNAQAAQRLLIDHPTPDPVELQEMLSDIVLAGQRGANVIRDVRGLLRRADSDQGAVDMNEVVREVTGLLQSDAILKHISVRLDMSPDLPPVFGVRVQLQQVVLNLFMNAYEAMSGAPDGPRELVVRTKRGPANVEFLVSDTGPGLSVETVERMFEPFFTTKPEGLGLGLSISRTIVRAHGGEIKAVRHADRGSTMSVTLPTPL